MATGFTPDLQLPYPEPGSGEPNNPPVHLKALAERLETVLPASVDFLALTMVPMSRFLATGRTPGVTDDLSDFEDAIADGRLIYLNEGDYRISDGISFPSGHPGMIGPGIHEANIYADIAAGATAITAANVGGQMRGFSVYAGLPGDDDTTRRSVARHGIDFAAYGGHGRVQDVYSYGFNGRGVRFTAIWDSIVGNLIVERCGNPTDYAFSVVGGTDTSNHTIFDRVQVELAYDRAMYVDSSSLSCTFRGIHSERLIRTTTTSADVSHSLRGGSCTYENVRIANDDATVSFMQLGNPGGSYRDLRCGGTTVTTEINYGGAGLVSILSSSLSTVSIPTTNVHRIRFDTVSLGAVTITDQAKGRVGFTDCVHAGNISLVNNTTVASLLRSYFETGFGVTTGSGNPTLYAYDCDFDVAPSVATARVYDSYFRNATTTFNRFGGQFHLHDCVFAGDVVIDQNSLVLRAKNCEFPGNLGRTSGSPVAHLYDCRLTAAAPTITGDWRIGSFSRSSVGGTSATTLGTLVRKVEVFDAKGTSLGYVPVYDAIT